jgi:hypothetical protein
MPNMRSTFSAVDAAAGIQTPETQLLAAIWPGQVRSKLGKDTHLVHDPPVLLAIWCFYKCQDVLVILLVAD